jgi:ADP-ribose pyrophosphatase
VTAAKAEHVGERRCVDAFVFCTWAGRRWLAMVERGDGLGWAVPGGGVRVGEFPAEAMFRELAEETGLVVDADAVWRVLLARRVPDPRGPVVTVPFVHHMGQVETLPPLKAGSDARAACWVRAGTFADLVDHVEIGLGGDLFPAHEQMIRDVIAATA